MHFLKFLLFSIGPKVICLLLLLSSSVFVCSQALLQGTVIDSASSLPVPQVNVWANHTNTISDAGGNFSLVVSPGDTLHFSHISYCDRVVRVDSKNRDVNIKVSLRQKIRLLREVKIYSYLSERAFKQKIIETTRLLSREEEMAKINSAIISYLARYAPTSPMDAYDNYIDYMKGPQGVVIFSSSPSKGLIRAFKNIINLATPSYKKFFNADSLERAPHLH
jgi:hypothetical protein